jgi:hypothetical protein
MLLLVRDNAEEPTILPEVLSGFTQFLETMA